MSDLATLKCRHSKGVLHCSAIDAHRRLPRGASEQGQNEVGRAIGLILGGPLSATAPSIKGEDPPVDIPVIDESMEKLGRYLLRG